MLAKLGFVLLGVTLAGSAGVANAALTFDVRVAGAGGKTASVDAVGDTVNLELHATITNADGNPANDGLTTTNQSLLSTGALLGNISTAIALSPFNGSSHQDTDGPSVITPVDLDADGDLDIGSNNNSSSANMFRASSDSLPTGTSFLYGEFTFTATDLTGASTSINVRPRAGTFGAIYREDGMSLSGSTGTVLVGAPVVVSVVPEPAALGLLTLGGVGLLARRRRGA